MVLALRGRVDLRVTAMNGYLPFLKGPIMESNHQKV